MSSAPMPVIPPNDSPLHSAQAIIPIINAAYLAAGMTGQSCNGCLPFADGVEDEDVTISMDPDTNKLVASPTGGQPTSSNIIGWFAKSAAAGGTSVFVNMADAWAALVAGGVPRLQVLIDMWEPTPVRPGGPNS